MYRMLSALFLALTMATSAQAVSYFPPLDPPSYLNAHITTATTTLVKTGPGTLRSICVNTVATPGTITIDDALTATTPTYGVITSPTTVTGVDPFCQTYNISFFTGLTIVTTGTQDITVNYQ